MIFVPQNLKGFFEVVLVNGSPRGPETPLGAPFVTPGVASDFVNNADFGGIGDHTTKALAHPTFVTSFCE